jgi:hypothetical protein
MGEAKRRREFLAARNVALATGDLDTVIEFARAFKQPLHPNREIAEMAMHKAITACVDLDIELRRKSKRWLDARGLMSHDDGEL